MDLLTKLKQQPLPFAEYLGIDLVSAGQHKIVGEMTVRPEFCTRPAVMHGGAIMAFADTLGGLATLASLQETANDGVADTYYDNRGQAGCYRDPDTACSAVRGEPTSRRELTRQPPG